MDPAGTEKEDTLSFYILSNLSYVFSLPLPMGKKVREAVIGLILCIVLTGIGKHILLQDI